MQLKLFVVPVKCLATAEGEMNGFLPVTPHPSLRQTVHI